MSKNKLPSELDIETLLDSISNEDSLDNDKEELLEYTNDSIPFLTKFNIRPGSYTIASSALYDFYKSWSKNPISKVEFNKTVSKFIYISYIHEIPYFHINVHVSKIVKKTFELISSRKRNKQKVKSFKRHFENFIKKYELDKPEIWVQSFVLFHLYDRWTYSIYKKEPLGYNGFIDFCRIYFKKKRLDSNKHDWYLVSKRVLDEVTSEQIEQLIEGRKKNVKKEE